MKPATYDFTVARSGSRPVRIRLKNEGGPMGINTAELRISWRGGSIVKAAPDGLAVSGNEVAWDPTPQERQALPRGKVARYSWLVNGEIYLEGRMEGTGSA